MTVDDNGSERKDDITKDVLVRPSPIDAMDSERIGISIGPIKLDPVIIDRNGQRSITTTSNRRKIINGLYGQRSITIDVS